ncbi:MAG: hypothetical protein Q7T33_07045 [Dehalococcoidia bacterium]|nr:hypothetical protein [Dehalococcoidia bacterium]
MALLGTLLRRPAARYEDSPAPPETAPPGPQLVLLVPSVAGISSYRLLTFADAAAAAEFAASSFNQFLRGNIQAFWALHHQPDGPSAAGAKGEALVIIREVPGSDIVYVLSFVDIDAAQAFARFEVERGLDPGLLLIYWASLARIEEGPEGVRLEPSAPPGAAIEAPAEELQPNAHPADETNHLDLIWPAAAAFVPHPTDVRELGREERAAMDHYHLQEVKGTGLLVAEQTPPKRRAPAEPEAAAPQLLLPSVAIAAAPEPVAAPAPAEIAAALPAPAEEPQTDALPDEEIASVEAVLPALAQTAPAPSVQNLDCASGVDIATVAQKLLKQKRWERHDKPFSGFGSPPGRF